MIGLGIVSLFLVVNASLRASLDDTVDNQFENDVVIDSGGNFVSGGLPDDIADAVNALPEVDAATGVRFGFAQIAGTPHGLRAIEPDTGFDLFHIEVAEGDVSGLDANGIAVFQGIAEERGWQVGDEIPVVFGETGEIPFTVAALLARRDLTGPFVMGVDAFEANLPDVGDAQIWVGLADGVTVDEARDDLESVVASFPSAEVQDLEEFKAAMKGQYDIILVLDNALLTLTIVIAMIGIVNVDPVGGAHPRSASPGPWAPPGVRCGPPSAGRRCSSPPRAWSLGVGVLFGCVGPRCRRGLPGVRPPAAQLAAFAAVTAAHAGGRGPRGRADAGCWPPSPSAERTAAHWPHGARPHGPAPAPKRSSGASPGHAHHAAPRWQPPLRRSASRGTPARPGARHHLGPSRAEPGGRRPSLVPGRGRALVTFEGLAW
jgi:putative ABC transport system permease protein